MPQVGLEPMILVFERAKTVHALERAATMIGIIMYFFFLWRYSPNETLRLTSVFYILDIR
jgi:hypothetical protein